MTVADLFVVGIGFDIAGASLLAKGVLLRPREIAALGTWNGISYGATVERCASRVDATTGLLSLGLGFLLQAIGYRVTLSGAMQETGSEEVVIAAALALVAITCVGAWWSTTKPKRLKRLLVQVVLATGDDELDEPWTYERVMQLVSLAQAAGWHPEDRDRFDEGVDRFVEQVIGVHVPRYLPSEEVLGRH